MTTRLRNYCVEYITNDGAYHMFSILTDDLDVAIANTLSDQRRKDKAIPRANVNQTSSKDTKFTMFNGFRINEFHP